jgi:hypothetical protein
MTGPGMLTDVVGVWLAERGVDLNTLKSGALIDGVYILPPKGLGWDAGHCFQGREVYNPSEDILHRKYVDHLNAGSWKESAGAFTAQQVDRSILP